MNYVFNPEATEERLQHGMAWQAGRRANNKPAPVFLTSRHSAAALGVQQGPPLAVITPQDTLYVSMHGGAGLDYVFDTYANGMESRYTARSLALLLVREGLPNDHIRIKMYSCGSGTVTLNQEPFAFALKRELARLGHIHATVQGYDGDISSNYAIASPDGGQTFDPGTHRVAIQFPGQNPPWSRARDHRYQMP